MRGSGLKCPAQTDSDPNACEDVNIDIAADGTVYGVELLNANEQLTGDHGALIVESGGERKEIALVA